MPIRGSCLCGSVTFEIDRAVGPFELCHCSRCRKVSGSQGVAAVGVKTADFRMLSGAELIKSFTAPILDEPPAYESWFCSQCGSPVPNPSPDGSWFEIAAGLFDDPIGLQPDKHIYIEFTPDWDTIRDVLPQYSKEELRIYRTDRARKDKPE